MSKETDKISVRDLYGDLHIHTIEGSDDAKHTLEDIIRSYGRIGVRFIAVTDHNTCLSREDINSNPLDSNELLVISGAEVDIDEDGELKAEEATLEKSKFTIASIHENADESTDTRLLKAIKNPFVDVIGHPGRYCLNHEIDWDTLVTEAVKYDKALEVNLLTLQKIMSGVKEDINLFETIEILGKDAISSISDSGVLISIGTDLHNNRIITDNQNVGFNWRYICELADLLANAGIKSRNIINTWPIDRINLWVESHREQIV
ncbi:MAG: PHP domain-containing protein [Candidatus Shapirobacteria bacterium]